MPTKLSHTSLERIACSQTLIIEYHKKRAQIAQADRAIQDAERVLQRANNNLRAAHTVTAQRQREVEDLRAIHRSLAAVKLPDLTPIRVLLDAVR